MAVLRRASEAPHARESCSRVDQGTTLVGTESEIELRVGQAACRREKSNLASRAAGRRAAEGSDSAGMP